MDDKMKLINYKDATSKATEQFEQLFMCGVQIDTFILEEAIVRALKSQKTVYEANVVYNIDSFKMAGLLCFWLRKLKPFRVVSGSTGENKTVNEAIAFLTGIRLVIGYRSKNGKSPKIPNLTPSFIHNIILSLRYNSHSPNSTAFIFESMCL